MLSASRDDDKIAWYENLKYYTGTTDVAVSQITVFPNPTTGNIKIDLSNIKNPDNAKLEIYDATGKMILHKIANQNVEEVDLSKFANGTYILKIQTHNRIEVMNIINR